MSKELEAWNEIRNRSTYDDTTNKWVVNVDDVDKLFAPPTADEVCEALSEFYRDEVSYDNERHNHMFYFEKSRLGILRYFDGKLDFIHSSYHNTNYLPPHLIEMIGKFYKSLEKGE